MRARVRVGARAYESGDVVDTLVNGTKRTVDVLCVWSRGREDRKKFSLDWKVSKVSSKEYIKNHLFFLNDIPYRRQCANIRIYKCVCSHFLPFFALFSTSHHLMIKM